MAVNGESASSPTPFGKEMRQHFMFADGYRNLNHSSFGAYPRVVRDAQRRYQDATEAAPDLFIRYDLAHELLAARKAVAQLINAKLSNLVLVPNATTAVNVVLRNLQYEPGDRIVYLDAIYPACEKAVISVSEITPVEGVKVDFKYPISDDVLVGKFEETVTKERAAGNRVRLAIFDTIVSMPGVRLPFEKLTRKCHELGVLSCIDAAHGIGQIPLDMNELDADFFVSNCHKWLYTPRGCAVFHVPERNQKMIRTSFPTSHGFAPADPANAPRQLLPPSIDPDTNPFVELFNFVGTLDITAYLVLPEALRFRKEVCGGEKALMKYVADLTRKGNDYVAKELGTEVMDNEEGTHREGNAMGNVRLPLDQSGDNAVKIDSKAGPQGVVQWFGKTSVEYNTFLQTYWYNNAWWVRLAGQSYLEMADFEYAVVIIKKLCEGVKNGEHMK